MGPGNFPQRRLRRLRSTPALRRLVRETRLHSSQLVYPLFVRSGRKIKKAIGSMPGIFQWSADWLPREVERAQRAGVTNFLLFGIPEHKDARASGAYDRKGIIPTSLRVLKREFPESLIMTDVCLCEYMSHGHCGLVKKTGSGFRVENDATLPLLARSAVAHAEAGADLVAPSDMMDGRVGAIRQALDRNGFPDLPIMSYAAKFASAFYGPFREAAESAPHFGDRRSYQMDSANGREALQEVAQDLAEGADIVMVKPGLAYLDVLYRVKQEFNVPTAAYAVSGEFSMIQAAAARGWINGTAVQMESLLGMVRAGADIVITYAAPEIAEALRIRSG